LHHSRVSGRYHKLPRRLDDDYILESKELGTGHNGSVYLATSKTSSEKFAVKPYKLFRISKAQRRELLNEVEVTLAMDHPHVARLRDVYEDEEYLQMVTEYLGGGELFDRITKVQRFGENDARKATHQILLAVNYVHKKDIVHRDIKLENFMYDSKAYEHLKLIDFGFSRFTHNKRMKLGCGTLAYMAPEVLGESYTMKCDIWSVGVVVFILLMGYMPFSGDNEEVHDAIVKGKYNIKEAHWSKVSETGRSFIQALLQLDAELRPSAETALQLPWLVKGGSEQEANECVDESIVSSLRQFAKASRFRRACMSMMAWTLTNEERAQVREAFVSLDSDKTGTITLYELKTVLEQQVGISSDEVQEIFNALDSSNNHEEVNYSDFLAAMVASRIALHDDMLHDTFKRFDMDNAGFITAKNLRHVLGGCLTEQETEGVMREADLSHDGRISWEEFSQYMHSSNVDERHLEAMDKVIENELTTSPRAHASKRMLSSREGPREQASIKSKGEELTCVKEADKSGPTPSSPSKKQGSRLCTVM